jgi:hypothetical protein
VLDKPVPKFVWFPASFCHVGGGFWLVIPWHFIMPGLIFQVFVGEFDPGSGRTLAACLTHASRAERPFGVLERRTGE